ncbi:MAG: hypothetical protein JRI79_14265 [Deltaproteobacteria bacterium]|nr:hypothetical protein [Deltaproteobacteria bacterium]MBW1919260.1 hypothetical protein [Deltaproteobacteria bacterium]MBW1935081.1 hypothetical protein [Deltaproteobacteria bacterium]MBW1979110.1 hypothetical protein [Deltaproteobacteria bacterium]MBW2045903.1 hypothetical protein [Deltaproteobacteria bacterium]
MDFETFVEGPLLWAVFLALLAGVALRIVFFFIKTIGTQNSPGSASGIAHTLHTFGRLFIPFHMAAAKKPFYATIRYVFHACLFIVPIWFSGHVALWSESRFGWDWVSLPDLWSDWMSIILLGIAAYLFIRRIVSPYINLDSQKSDYALIIIVSLPFLTGYLSAHGTLDALPFFGDNMLTIHVLSGEAMILVTAVLFCRTRLNPAKCTGCASCELSCPTATLETKDQGNLRIFNYSHYQCICCGACVNTCPEDAAELRHEISLRRLFQVLPKQEIRSVELKACERCGALFVPQPLFEKIHRTFSDDYLNFCPNCRKVNIGNFYRTLSRSYTNTKEGQHAQVDRANASG